MKRAASFLLAAMLTCSGCAAWMPEAVSVSVSAADSSVTFDEATGTLTLSGNVDKAAVQAYAQNAAVKAGRLHPELCCRRIAASCSKYSVQSPLIFPMRIHRM